MSKESMRAKSIKRCPVCEEQFVECRNRLPGTGNGGRGSRGVGSGSNLTADRPSTQRAPAPRIEGFPICERPGSRNGDTFVSCRLARPGSTAQSHWTPERLHTQESDAMSLRQPILRSRSDRDRLTAPSHVATAAQPAALHVTIVTRTR